MPSDRTVQRSPPLKANPTPPPSTRRDRRAAARTREQVRTGQRSRTPAAPQPRPAWRSPIALITGGVLVVAVVGLIALQFLPGSGHSGPAVPGTRTSAGILVPAIGTPTNVAFGRSLGRPDAPVRLTVWSDFQCPACKSFAETVEGRLITNYVVPGKLRIDYRDLDIIGPESDAAAAAARCADDQGKFWQYHDVLFANQAAENSGAITPARLKDMADAIGLDRTKFDACLPSTDLLTKIQVETRDGKLRGQSTPTLDFGTQVIAGNPGYDSLKTTIDQLLVQAGAAGSASPAASGSASAASPAASAPAGSAAASGAASASP